MEYGTRSKAPGGDVGGPDLPENKSADVYSGFGASKSDLMRGYSKPVSQPDEIGFFGLDEEAGFVGRPRGWER